LLSYIYRLFCVAKYKQIQSYGHNSAALQSFSPSWQSREFRTKASTTFVPKNRLKFFSQKNDFDFRRLRLYSKDFHLKKNSCDDQLTHSQVSTGVP